MANWKWMFPQGNFYSGGPICGECLCIKKTWRSTKSRATGLWSLPVVVSTDLNVQCGEGAGWQLVSECTAEFVQYERCDQGGTGPAPPAIATPDCIPISQPCPTCLALPELATITLPASWGTKVNPGLSLCSADGGPFGGLRGRDLPCGAPNMCDVCPHIPALTMIHDFTAGSGGGCNLDSITPGCGAPTGPPCNGFINTCRYDATYPCCILGTAVNLRFVVCTQLFLDSPISPCRVILRLSNTWVAPCHGVSGVMPFKAYHYMVFQSAPVSSVAGLTLPVSRIVDCTSADGVGYGSAVRCTGAPSSLNIVFSA